MTLPADWWTTNLSDEPCDGCGVRPSKHAGHGSYTCQACHEARWCPSCTYLLSPDHVCPTGEELARREAETAELLAWLKDIEP